MYAAPPLDSDFVCTQFSLRPHNSFKTCAILVLQQLGPGEADRGAGQLGDHRPRLPSRVPVDRPTLALMQSFTKPVQKICAHRKQVYFWKTIHNFYTEPRCFLLVQAQRARQSPGSSSSPSSIARSAAINTRRILIDIDRQPRAPPGPITAAVKRDPLPAILPGMRGQQGGRWGGPPPVRTKTINAVFRGEAGGMPRCTT